MTQSIAYLRLESGEVFPGKSFGFTTQTSGEVVFSTGMVGYPESLTDPSFKNQILVMTYPLIGNYGVPKKDELESNQIHVSALIVGSLSESPSHWTSTKTLDQWLKEEKVPGIYDIDTRELTKLIREKGVVRGQIVYDLNTDLNFEFESKNLVAMVSTKEPYQIKNLDNGPTVLVIDCGLKANQLRCLMKAGAGTIHVVPWDYDFMNTDIKFDRLFISNGPGDPTDCQVLIERVAEFISGQLIAFEMSNIPKIPVFGICLGHQIISLAMGAKTYKMKYGNRGLNIPAQLVGTKRCLITSQNHGYAVDVSSLPESWAELFINANDGSNEGIFCRDGPFYSVQFHPEAKPGPQDSEILFDLFIKNQMNQLWSVFNNPLSLSEPVPKRRKVLVLGSGGLSIGQSGEFDYSGSQAIKAYREES